jgi:membrane fusion protein (multidrug efflux system)
MPLGEFVKSQKVSVLIISLVGMVLIGGLAWKESKTGEVSAALSAAIGTMTGAQAPAKPGSGGSGGGPGGTGAPGGGPGGPGGGPKGPVGVEVVAAKSGTVQDLVAAVGTLRANESVVIKPEIAGRIAKLGFSDGHVIEGGVARGGIHHPSIDFAPDGKLVSARL